LLGQSNMEGQGIVEIANGHGNGNGTLAYAVQNTPSAGFPTCDFAQAASVRQGCVPRGANLNSLKRADGSWEVWPSATVHYFGKVGRAWGLVHPAGPLSVGFGVNDQRGVGPEYGFGLELVKHYGNETEILLLKVAWGGTSLGVDWRPPSSVKAHGGEVGWCYTNFTAHAHSVLAAIGKPYEIAGMMWHQGWNDGCSAGMVAEYERNLANLIRDIRHEFEVPDLAVTIPVSGATDRPRPQKSLFDCRPLCRARLLARQHRPSAWNHPSSVQCNHVRMFRFTVGASAGQSSWRGNVDRRLGIMRAQYNVTTYGEFSGKVGAQETRGFVRFFDETNGACNQGYHYNCNGETYYYIGVVAGQSMAALLDGVWKQPFINTTAVNGDFSEIDQHPFEDCSTVTSEYGH